MTSVNLFLANPRGFCTGVTRAIGIVEKALAECEKSLYLYHEIVHNKHVIEDLNSKGIVSIDELDKATSGKTIVFSAHGVGLDRYKKAKELDLKIVDATCPLVEKVHRQITSFAEENMEIIVIGSKTHPEIIGTVGQVPGYKKIHILNSTEEVEKLNIPSDTKIGYVTQTTLSLDDCQEIIEALKHKFPSIHGLGKNNICYATTHRQNAIKEIVKKAGTIIILGSKSSSNSKQLQQVALKNGAKKAFLIDDTSELDWQELEGEENIGIGAGASAPEYLVQELLEHFSARYNKINLHEVIIPQK